jgi:hypothetical protein
MWRHLLAELRRRGGGRHESGAFLIGRQSKPRSRIVDFILYDDLDPHCLDTGIVRFDGTYFAQLWEICRSRELAVVADVHTHPGEGFQSPSDRDNPMIAQAGHVAFIVPDLAANSPPRRRIGMYRYRGDHQWTTVAPSERSKFLHIGF